MAPVTTEERLEQPGGRLLGDAWSILLNLVIPKRSARLGWIPFVARRGDELIVLLAARDAPQTKYLTQPKGAAIGPVSRLYTRKLLADGSVTALVDQAWVLRLTRWLKLDFTGLASLLAAKPAQRQHRLTRVIPDYRKRLSLLRDDPALIDFLVDESCPSIVPFDEPARLPSGLPATPRQRSVLFVHNNYYHFNHLSEALRKRGWDSATLSLYPSSSPERQFFHGEDINLHHDDQNEQLRRTREFFRLVPERFGSVHFYGHGQASIFPANYESSDAPERLPWDFLELRRHNLVIGYMPSGCIDGPRQSSIKALTGGVCSRCVWENNPRVCSDGRNLAWGEKLDAVCDWVGLECDWATPERVGPRFVRRPVITALQPEFWGPDLSVPDDMRVSRAEHEVLIYHGVGNYAMRRVGDRDIKGTGALMDAIERLKSEGVPVKLLFATDIPSTQVRFLQTQADIVVDQLNYGRYGANARESMMLGKPVIGSLNPVDAAPLSPNPVIVEAPIVQATEETIYERLKELVADAQLREELGRASRRFALKWHAADVCALRYERIIDRIRSNEIPDADEVFA